MSKYYDCERIADSLERIARSLELLLSAEDLKAKFDEKMKELHKKAKEEEVEELAEEQVKEPQEALKEPKQEELVKEEEVKKVEIVKAEPATIDPELVKQALEEHNEEFLELAKKAFIIVEEEPKVEPKKAPVKRGDSRHEIRKRRISPYRIEEKGKKAPSSGFRIKED